MPSPYTKSETRRYRIYRYSTNLQPISVPPAEQSTPLWVIGRSKTGRLLPNWRKLIRDGKDATTEFSGWEQDFEVRYAHVDASYRRQVSPNVWQIYRTYDSSFINQCNMNPISADLSSTVVTEALNLAIAQLYKKINKAHHQFQGGVFLGEIHKTAKLMTGVVKRFKQTVLQTVTGMRKTRNQVKTASNKVRRQALANAWLEGAFGWKPLLHDAEDLAIALARMLNHTERTHIKAIAGSEKVISHGSSQISFSYLRANLVQTEKCEASVLFRGFLQASPYKGTIAPLERMISLSGFDFRSFIPTMWELVPYSFLVDYFTNVGDVLYALTVDTSMVKVLWRTIRINSIREHHVTPLYGETAKNVLIDPDNKDPVVTGKAGYYAVKYRTVGRESVSVPYLVPTLKGFGDLNWKQFTNMGALLAR